MIKLVCRTWWVAVALMCCTVGPARAERITVAAAADLRHAMDALVATFNRVAPNDQVTVVYGSSGQFLTQIQQGAPFDLYFSADEAYPQALVSSGFAFAPVRRYAVGRLVLWSPQRPAADLSLSRLTDPRIQHIAIASPEHAPYGKRAREALQAAGVWSQVQGKLVYGENIAQAAQFVQTGNAQVGLIALSLVSGPDTKLKGAYTLIPQSLHQPLNQGFVVTRLGGGKPLARRFADHVVAPMSQVLMAKYGFVLPPSH